LAPFLLALGSLTFILFPGLWRIVFPAYIVPLFSLKWEWASGC
jgi:hypothetical protein